MRCYEQLFPFMRMMLVCFASLFWLDLKLPAQVTTLGDPDLSITNFEAPKGAEVLMGDGTPWFLEKNQIIKFDLQNQTQTAPLPIEHLGHVGFAFGSVEIGSGSFWGYGKAHDVEGIHRIDLSTGKCVAAIPLKPRKGQNVLRYGEGALWVFNLHDGNLKRIDPNTNQVSGEIEVGKGFWEPEQIADGFIWTIGLESGLLKRIDPNSLKIVDEFSVGPPQKTGFLEEPFKGGEFHFAVGEGMIWVEDKKPPPFGDFTYTLLRIDPKTHEQVANFELGNYCACGPPAIWSGYVWVSEMFRRGDLILKINAKTGQIAQYSTLGHVQLVVQGGSLWAIRWRSIWRIQEKETRYEE